MRSNFQAPVRHRQRVVKDRSVGEISHTEVVEPFQRAGVELPFVLVLHAEFAGEHLLSHDVEGSGLVELQPNAFGKKPRHLTSSCDRGFDLRHHAFQVL